MKPIKTFLSILIIASGLQACSIFYFGHTKEKWGNLSEEEKLAAKLEYQQAIDARKDQEHLDKINSRTQSVIDYGAGKSEPIQK
jgi:hypothetical protein